MTIADPAPEPAALAGSLRCRVGVDLTVVAEVQESLDRHGDRYLQRIFTDHEVASCDGSAPARAASLAARFVAKEAVVKVLRPVGPRPEWRDIEVRRQANGACDLVLRGAAAVLADQCGVTDLSLSMSHDAGVAVAVVVALCRTDGPS